MENTINYKRLINQLQLIDIKLPLPNFIELPYLWLSSNLDETGALYDKYIKSPLDHQYHVPWFILSSSIMYLVYNNIQYNKIVKFHSNI